MIKHRAIKSLSERPEDIGPSIGVTYSYVTHLGITRGGGRCGWLLGAKVKIPTCPAFTWRGLILDVEFKRSTKHGLTNPSLKTFYFVP